MRQTLYNDRPIGYNRRQMSHFDRVIQLSSGVRWPLRTVAGCVGQLEAYLDTDDPKERDLVYFLRQVCLGQKISDEQREALRTYGLLQTSDGQLEPQMKDVVLAAVRGEGRALHVVSPFTDSWDRALSDFLNARIRIRSEIDDRGEYEAFLKDDPLQQYADKLLEKGKRAAQNLDTSWLDRLRPKPSQDDNLPEKS
jgi:hypothetical protein